MLCYFVGLLLLSVALAAQWDFSRPVVDNFKVNNWRLYAQGVNQDSTWTPAEISALQQRVFYVPASGTLCVACPQTDKDPFNSGLSRRVEVVYLASWKGDGLKDGQVLTVDYHIHLENTTQEGALLQMNSHIAAAGGKAQSLLMLRIAKGQIVLRGWAVNAWKNVGTDHLLGIWPKNQLLRFRFQVKMTQQPSGYIRMWVNDTLKFTLDGKTRDNTYPGGLQAGAYGKAVDRVFIHQMNYSVSG